MVRVRDAAAERQVRIRLRCTLLAPGSTICSGPIAEPWNPLKSRSRLAQGGLRLLAFDVAQEPLPRRWVDSVYT
jgi:hypothetical protein